MPRFRLLPLVIFSAVLMLSVRMGNLWQDLALAFTTVSLPQNQAVAAGTAPMDQPSPDVMKMNPPLQVAAAGTEAKPEGEGAKEKKPEAGKEGVNPNVTVGNRPPVQDPLREPMNFSQTEIDVLQKLAERREMIEARERELNTREGLIKAAEARIDAKVGELRTLETSIKGLLKQHDEQERAKLDQLVRIYAAMKPKEAARIFDDLDMQILMSIMENMKEAKSAPILAAMDPEKARSVTGELSRRRQLPVPEQTMP